MWSARCHRGVCLLSLRNQERGEREIWVVLSRKRTMAGPLERRSTSKSPSTIEFQWCQEIILIISKVPCVPQCFRWGGRNLELHPTPSFSANDSQTCHEWTDSEETLPIVKLKTQKSETSNWFQKNPCPLPNHLKLMKNVGTHAAMVQRDNSNAWMCKMQCDWLSNSWQTQKS